MHEKTWDITERSVETDTYKLVTQDKYGNLTTKWYIHHLETLLDTPNKAIK